MCSIVPAYFYTNYKVNIMLYQQLEIMKYNCVKSFLHKELIFAERDRDKSEIVVEDEKLIRDNALKIIDILESNKCTFENIKNLISRFPIYLNLYKKINVAFSKHFGVGDEFIPSLFVFEVLNIYKNKGFTDFIEFDFLKLQAEFEIFLRTHKEYRKFISKHFTCAYDVVVCMEQNVHRKNKNKKKKQ